MRRIAFGGAAATALAAARPHADPNRNCSAACAAATSDRNAAAPPGMRLLQVQTCFRHGARTPIDDIGDRPVEWRPSEQRPYTRAAERKGMCSVSLLHPGDGSPWDALEMAHGKERSLVGGGKPGMLTNVGFEQAVRLGAALRERYIDPHASSAADVSHQHLLPSEWPAAQQLVTTRSTFVERTVFTASAVLTGLYPTAAAAGDMAAQVHLNVPRGSQGGEEYMVFNPSRCERLQQLFKQASHRIT
jgi:hypothetical protein